MEETRNLQLPAWVVPIGLIGFAWGVSRLRRGDSSPLAWGVTAVTAPLAVAGLAQMSARRREPEHAEERRDRNPLATAVGTALSGLIGAMVPR